MTTGAPEASNLLGVSERACFRSSRPKVARRLLKASLANFLYGTIGLKGLARLILGHFGSISLLLVWTLKPGRKNADRRQEDPQVAGLLRA